MNAFWKAETWASIKQIPYFRNSAEDSANSKIGQASVDLDEK